MISPRVVECPTSSRGKELPWLQSEKEGIKGGGGEGQEDGSRRSKSM